MLQTVYARAKETQMRGAIRDEKAVEIVRKLDYDFSAADKDKPMRSGVIARTIVLDRLVSGYLAQHPGAVVVNLVCGLDTRCYRMTGFCHWYNLDLPQTIDVRRKLLPEEGYISQISMSAMNLFVNLSFCAAREYPAECLQTRLDIDSRLKNTIKAWKEA